MEDLNKNLEKDIHPEQILTMISGIIPNTKYFESRFDLLQVQINEIRRNQEIDREQVRDFKLDVDRRFNETSGKFDQIYKRIDDFKSNVDDRFKQVDLRFEQVDKRFEQVDKRFEQVDKRFEQMIASIDKLSDKLEFRDRDQRSFTLKMFTIAIMVSVLGVLGAFFKIIGIF